MRRSQTPEDREWLATFFAEALAEPSLRQRVGHHATQLREPDTPNVTPSDVQAAVPYLRACVFNMTPDEAAALTIDDLAALWARGAVGAAKYRARASTAAAPHRGYIDRNRRRRAVDSADE
jgi:hypothetical protein